MNKLSIIIPVFNMGLYIENTINSIINQNSTCLEIIIIDGGSTDGTIELLEKYKKKISYFVSEKDDGMYSAISKGMSIANGEILAWLNADDIYFPWTINKVLSIFDRFKQINWLCGIPAYLNEDGSIKKIYNKIACKSNFAIKNGWHTSNGLGYLQQESMFWRRNLYEKCGGIDVHYKYAADFDLWCRFALYEELWTLDIPLAAFRIRQNSLSKKNKTLYENEVHLIKDKLSTIPFLFSKIGDNLYLNKIIRLCYFSKTYILSHSLFDENIIPLKCIKNASSMTLSQLFLEYKINKINKTSDN